MVIQAKASMTRARGVAVEVAGDGWILNMCQRCSWQNLLIGWMWNLRVKDDLKILPEQLAKV